MRTTVEHTFMVVFGPLNYIRHMQTVAVQHRLQASGVVPMKIGDMGSFYISSEGFDPTVPSEKEYALGFLKALTEFVEVCKRDIKAGTGIDFIVTRIGDPMKGWKATASHNPATDPTSLFNNSVPDPVPVSSIPFVGAENLDGKPFLFTGTGTLIDGSALKEEERKAAMLLKEELNEEFPEMNDEV